ncbi:polyprenol monophosphomannose synthase [Candidatus Marinimicrobia bacterium]|nr:polyprenol monophosphomannose synthase [Candidatus Neomarinimicrobiota bacterium]
MKSIAISPTYNEKKNISELIYRVLGSNEDIEILIVDDNSPDGTADVVKSLMHNNSKIHLYERSGKLGLGTAYCAGFKWALDRGFDRIIQIDADMSHNPDDIGSLLAESKTSDVVIGSRYINGVNVVNWPLRRLILSYAANLYAQIITGLPIKDATGGFKCFRARVLESIDLSNISSEGYSFQIEMNFISWVKGFKVKEIPIIFSDRTIGESKMSRSIIFEAIYMVPLLKLKKIFGQL